MERLKVEEVIVGTTSPEVLPSRPHCKMNGNKIGSEDKKTHECLQCFIIFSTERSMLRHNRKFHKEEYMQHLQKNNTVFLCYKCNQRFQSSAKLRQHSLSHGTDDKPFCCEICREGYSTFAELLTHRREVCPKRKFHCKVCGMNFQNLDSLETHKSVHLPRRRGRPPKKKATKWGIPDEETVSPEEEEEDEEDDDEDEGEEEEEEEEELDSRAEDQREPWSQKLWAPEMETAVPEEEVVLDNREGEQRASWSQAFSPRGCASEGQLPTKRGQLTTEDGCPPKKMATEQWTPDVKTVVPKEEEEEEEVDDRSDAQRASRAQTSSPQRCASESQQPGCNIPCPVDHCYLSFPSVEALRMHKKDVHWPQPPTQSSTPEEKTMVPKLEEEEEDVDCRAEDQRASWSQTSRPQGRASESQQPRYNIPCPVDYCDLTFPTVEALRVHKKDVHRPKPAPELAPPRLP